MKHRATVLCIRKGRILLVARDRGRWAMPGGRPKSGEPLWQAAVRELREETCLLAVDVRYVFQFWGASTRHLVFVARLVDGAEPAADHEIARCRWARLAEVKRLPASIPTKGIAELLLKLRHVVEQSAGRRADATGGIASERTLHERGHALASVPYRAVAPPKAARPRKALHSTR